MKGYILLAVVVVLCLVSQIEGQKRRRKNRVCPSFAIGSRHRVGAKPCNVDSDCRRRRQKCCVRGGVKRCVRGIKIKANNPGFCPVRLFGSSCVADKASCTSDRQCARTEKCCLNSNCGYKECVRSVSDEQVPELLCPDFGFPFAPGPEVPRCTGDISCSRGQKCCFQSGDKVCVDGIRSGPPNPGSCPAQQLGRSHCIADFPSCVSDTQCKSNEKCCRNSNCGYRECMPVAVSSPNNLVCPSFGFVAAPGPQVPRCSNDSSCRNDEKCCFKAGVKVCVTGVDTSVVNPGFCPTTPSSEFCIADIGSCVSDAQCGSNRKCCPNTKCSYNECRTAVSSNRRRLTDRS